MANQRDPAIATLWDRIHAAADTADTQGEEASPVFDILYPDTRTGGFLPLPVKLEKHQLRVQITDQLLRELASVPQTADKRAQSAAAKIRRLGRGGYCTLSTYANAIRMPKDRPGRATSSVNCYLYFCISHDALAAYLSNSQMQTVFDAEASAGHPLPIKRVANLLFESDGAWVRAGGKDDDIADQDDGEEGDLDGENMTLLELYQLLDDATVERLAQAKKLAVHRLPQPTRRQAQERHLVEVFECSVEKVVGQLTEDELRRALQRVRFDSHEENVGKLLDLPTASMRQLRRLARAVFIDDSRPYSNARVFLEAGDWPLSWVLRHSVVRDAVVLPPVGADKRGYVRGLFVSWLETQTNVTGSFRWPIARLVNLLGENRAESRLTLAAIERLAEVLDGSGVHITPNLRAFDRSPGISTVVTIGATTSLVAPPVVVSGDEAEDDEDYEDDDSYEGDEEDGDFEDESDEHVDVDADEEEEDDEDEDLDDDEAADYVEEEDVEEDSDSDDEEDEPIIVTPPPPWPASTPPRNATASAMTPHQPASGPSVDTLPAPTTTLELCARRLKFILTAAASTRRLDAAALESAIEVAAGETRLSRIELARLRSLAHRYADGLEPIEATLTWLAASLDLTARHRLVHTARRLASPAPHAHELLDILAADLLAEPSAPAPIRDPIGALVGTIGAGAPPGQRKSSLLDRF